MKPPNTEENPVSREVLAVVATHAVFTTALIMIDQEALLHFTNPAHIIWWFTVIMVIIMHHTIYGITFAQSHVNLNIRAAGPTTRVAGSNPLELVSALLSVNLRQRHLTSFLVTICCT